MLCKDKLANLDFKSKKNNANHILLPFFFFFFLIWKRNNKNNPRMKYMNVMQCPKNKDSKNNKKDGHKKKSDEAQRPCQKDSIRSSLLHPKLFRCNSSIRVIIRIRVTIHVRILSNSRIGIKV